MMHGHGLHINAMSQSQRKPETIDWSKVNWKERDARIAEKLGIVHYRVSMERKARGLPRGTGAYHYKNGHPGQKIRKALDFTKKDIVLAKIHKVSRERIRQLRK